MRSHAVEGPRFWSSFLVAALFSGAAVTLFVLPSSKVDVDSGHRICAYVWNQGVGNPERRMVSFVADYSEHGACPTVDYHKVSLPGEVGSWTPLPDTWERQPAPKLTCEEFQALLNLVSPAGGDPCAYMDDDRLYAVTSFKPGDTGATRRLWDLPSIWDLRP